MKKTWQARGSASKLLAVGQRPQFFTRWTSVPNIVFPRVRCKRKSTGENTNTCLPWLSLSHTRSLLPHFILFSSKSSPHGHEYQEAGIIGAILETGYHRIFALALSYDTLMANSLNIYLRQFFAQMNLLSSPLPFWLKWSSVPFPSIFFSPPYAALFYFSIA